MPWNNQNGGGGGGWKSGGGGGGPWGQGPQGGGSGNQQPDLEELLKRSQDKLKQALPGGGGTGLIWLVAIIGLLVVWGSQSFYTVKPGEEGVVLRFGKLQRTVGDGFHFIAWPIETLERININAVNQINFGSTAGNEALTLAGDQNLVDVHFTVFWKVSDSYKYLFKVSEPKDLIRVVSESAMRDVVGRTQAEQLSTIGREQAQVEVQKLMQSTLDSYNAGIEIRGVNIEKAPPPISVIPAFEEVQRAEQNKDTFIRTAEQFKNKRLGEARGEAYRIVEDAKAYKAKITTEAQGEAQRFLSVYTEYAKAKDVTRKRLFLETVEKVLSQANKVVIEQGAGGPGVIPYLPLPEVQKRLQSNTNNQGGQ